MTAAPPYRYVVFTVPDVPPSWPNLRLHWAELARRKAMWRDRTRLCAQVARNQHRWRLPRPEDACRRVEIVMHRSRALDPDNLAASVKPLLDGLVGVLVHDDRPRYVDLVVRQVQVPRGQEITRIRVATAP